ncbi:MAG: flagellar hook-associated protein FlgK [Ruminococcus sp.]|nr:flagellar hook-associated protein FlgK [Ruminococcus sp.]
MRPTFLGFEASKTALYATQKALDITGNNLANISSEGYTRQRVDQVSMGYYCYGTKYNINARTHLAGMGTNVLGISQTRDKLLDNAFREQYSEVGDYSQRNKMLTDIESVIQELDIGTDGNGYGLRYAIEEMYTSLQDLSVNASSITDANVVVSAFSNFATTMRQMSTALEEKCEQYRQELEIDVQTVNSILEKLTVLNRDIKRAIVAGGYTEEYGPNELLDERNLLLDELSAFGEVGVKYNADGTADVSLAGRVVVKDEVCEKLDFSRNTDGTVSVRWHNDGSNAGLGLGIITASTEIINGRGNGVISTNESSVMGFRYYKDRLDELASRIADVCNNTIPSEVDENGNIVSYVKFFGAQMTNENGETEVFTDMYISSDNIRLMDNIKDDATNILTNDGVTKDNKYILELISNLSTSKIAFTNGEATFEDYITGYLTNVGNDITYYNTRSESAQTFSEELLNTRESVTGVSENEETVNMLTYNRAYQAAARMMTVMDELLDVLINQMGV